MERKDQKFDLADLSCDHNVNSVPFPKLRVIPVREVPDDCVLVCVGPICYLACYAVGEDPFDDCQIVCSESGQCYIVCPYFPEEE